MEWRVLISVKKMETSNSSSVVRMLALIRSFMQNFQLPGTLLPTLHYDVFDAPSLARLPFGVSLVLFAKLGEDERSDGFYDSREDWISGVEKPSLGVGWVVEVDSNFED